MEYYTYTTRNGEEEMTKYELRVRRCEHTKFPFQIESCVSAFTALKLIMDPEEYRRDTALEMGHTCDQNNPELDIFSNANLPVRGYNYARLLVGAIIFSSDKMFLLKEPANSDLFTTPRAFILPTDCSMVWALVSLVQNATGLQIKSLFGELFPPWEYILQLDNKYDMLPQACCQFNFFLKVEDGHEGTIGPDGVWVSEEELDDLPMLQPKKDVLHRAFAERPDRYVWEDKWVPPKKKPEEEESETKESEEKESANDSDAAEFEAKESEAEETCESEIMFN
jgi:hypothetical protein